MISTSATFAFWDKRLGDIRVVFDFHNGCPMTVQVVLAELSKTFDNTRGAYRPCVTHCIDLIGMTCPKPKKPRDNFAKARRAKTPRTVNGTRISKPLKVYQ